MHLHTAKKMIKNIHSISIVIYSIVRTFLSYIPKFRASALMKICVVKGELQEGQKSCQNGTNKPCLASNDELIFEFFDILK